MGVPAAAPVTGTSEDAMAQTPQTEAQCPIRPGEPCHLCQCGSGPETCGLVYLVMTDPELCAALACLRAREEATTADPP